MSTSQDRPWESEPDLVRFEAHGIACVVRRTLARYRIHLPLGQTPRLAETGHLCGYIRLPEGHPWRAAPYRLDSDANLGVHGGISFVSRGGDPDLGEGFWLGFACAHAGDFRPGAEPAALDGPLLGVYREIGYVIRQTADLARQAREVLTYEARFKEVIDLWGSSGSARDALLAFAKAWRDQGAERG